MTATVDLSLSLEEQCAAILAATDQRDAELRAERLKNPLIRLWDGQWNLVHVVRSETSQEWEDVDNDSAPGTLVIPAGRPEAVWLWDLKARHDRGEKILCYVTVDHCGRRWSGHLKEPEFETDERGVSTLTAQFVSDYYQLKHRTLWANPALPAVFQFPKTFLLAGPSRWVLLTALYLNLKRAHGGPTYWFDDPLASEAVDNQTNWPIVVKPVSFADDMAAGTVWSVLTSRFASWHDAAEMILRDAELSVQWRRWLTGDPPPWPGANIRHGALVVDIVDKSGVLEGTANGGTPWDGLTRMVRDFVNDFTENAEQAITGIPDVPEYQQPGFISTDPRVPYVFFGPRHPGLLRQRARWTPAEDLRLTVGGHSNPFVNAALSAAIRGIGAAISQASLGVIADYGPVADALAAPIYTDVIAAWNTVLLLQRAQASGDFAPYERVLDVGTNAWTITALMVIRAGMVESETQFSAEMEIADAAPYVVGAPGYGHFDKGDRILTQIKGDPSRRIHVQRVKKLTLAAERGRAPHHDIGLGEQYDRGDPIARLAAGVERAMKIGKEVGLL